MKTIHLSLHTRGLALPQLSVFSQNIVTTLNGNKNFPELYPNMLILQQAIDELDAAILNTRPGNKTSTAAARLAQEKVNRTLKAVAAHVEYASNNDEIIALSSGFSLKQAPKPLPHIFEALHGSQKGTVNLKTPRHTNSSFIWQYTSDVSGSWVISGTTLQASHTVINLAVGKEYWFRVAVVNKDGQQPFSDPVSLIVI